MRKSENDYLYLYRRLCYFCVSGDSSASSSWEDAPVELEPDYDPLAQPEPEVEFDQRVQW